MAFLIYTKCLLRVKIQHQTLSQLSGKVGEWDYIQWDYIQWDKNSISEVAMGLD